MPINWGEAHLPWQLTIALLVAPGHMQSLFSKMGIVEEEADESTLWLDILVDTKNATQLVVEPLLKEARELTAIFTATSKTAKENHLKKR